ncbi:hypothetical protein [Desulfovibrio litoralis]|uniref:YARHG domain-containing protein n=1 Tax=Desulfovibrio litoralis DSM 11393 TaxID=1121455 RepID=A0A1M7TPE1_9BACT|nr:hypothetical protein [Desulfovibrio litoralis]SHN72602.1 hypothetical protein SAMN02745728_02327 [Desulfovibrio litoralis DSM 11393]
MRIFKILALFFLLMCLVSCSEQDSKEQTYFVAASDFLAKSTNTIIGKYYSIQQNNEQTSLLRMLDIKSFTGEHVVYDLVEYEFNNKPSDTDMMINLGAVSVLDPDPDLTIKRRQDRLPKPYALTGNISVEKRGIEASLKLDQPNNGAMSCYRYMTTDQSLLTFEFCESGYRGINEGVFRHKDDYVPSSLVREVIASNPGFPEKIPIPKPNKTVTALENIGPQNVTTDIQYDAEIISSAVICLDNMGLFSPEEGNKIGTSYIEWIKMRYGVEYITEFFYIFKDALISSDKALQSKGMQDCEKRIADFDELAQLIGYKRPQTPLKK